MLNVGHKFYQAAAVYSHKLLFSRTSKSYISSSEGMKTTDLYRLEVGKNNASKYVYTAPINRTLFCYFLKSFQLPFSSAHNNIFSITATVIFTPGKIFW